jgi:hypothetical protein
MVVGLLAFATSSRADVACTNAGYCLEKTATPDPVEVGEPLTFTLRGFCNPSEGGSCARFFGSGLTDTLPEGVEFVSASATGLKPEACGKSAGTVTCARVVLFNDPGVGTEIPFVATIEVIPTQCGTFTSTASMGEESGTPRSRRPSRW